jgi:radical SAM protein with 4Fe4S-binding SPASM domain
MRPEEAGEMLVASWKKLLSVGFRLPGFIEYFPCGAMFERASVIYPDGRKLICTGLAEQVDTYFRGSLDSDACTEMHMNFMESNPWDKCPVCIHLPYCGGGCRWRAILATGRYDAVFCQKAFFDTILNEWLKLRWANPVEPAAGATAPTNVVCN